MQFNTGDKVRFLNETGSGVVKSVLSNGKILVEIEDGFEIPYYASELVLADANQSAERMQGEKKPLNIFNNKKWQPGDDFKEFTPEETFLSDSLYLVFEPKDIDKPIEGNLHFGLINTSAFNAIIIFNEQLPDNSCKFYKKMEVGPHSLTVIEELKRNQLEDFPGFRIDVLFFNHKSSAIPKPLSTLIKFKNLKFYKENNYKIYKGYNTKLFATKIVDLNNSNFSIEDDKPSETLLPNKKPTDTNLLEVDLHIEKINADYQSLEPSVILAHQLSFFKSKLDYAITHRYKKVVFIHGVGNGVLKSEILKILKEYIDLKARDASFLKYGKGATEVLIEF